MRPTAIIHSSACLLLIVAAAALAAIASPAEVCAETLQLSYTEGSTYQEIATPILVKAYKRLGLSVKALPLPGRRALRSSNHGLVDGEVIRLPVIEKDYPDLIRVPVPVIEISNNGYARTALAPVRTPGDLGRRSVGIIRGLIVLENFTEGTRRKMFNNQPEMFLALAEGRVDLILTNQFDALKYGDESLQATPEPIQSNQAYHYLHKKHADLVPRIAEALTTVLRQGERERVIEQLVKQWRARQ